MFLSFNEIENYRSLVAELELLDIIDLILNKEGTKLSSDEKDELRSIKARLKKADSNKVIN